MLESLRPTYQLNLSDLNCLAKDGKYFNLLPKALDDLTLLALAKQLRLAEKMNKGETDLKPDIAATLFVVMELIRGRRGLLKKKSNSLELSESIIFESVLVLQIVVEREIVGRIVGVKTEDQEKVLLDVLDGFASSGF